MLSVVKVWNDDKGSWAEVRVVGEVPQTPFSQSTPITFATADQVREALGLDNSPEVALDLGVIMNSKVRATPSVEKLGRVFVTGKSGSGKSYTVGVLIEELMKKRIPVVIVDRHGEYSSLKILEKENIPDDEPFFQKDDATRAFAEGIVEFGDPRYNPGADLELEYLLAAPPEDLVSEGQCTIVNLRGLNIQQQEALVEVLLSRLYHASTLRKVPPFFMFVDEAHLFAGKKSSPIVETMKLFAQEGRKFGANVVVITQKPQALDTTVRAQAGTWFIHKLTDLNDVRITIKSAEGLTTGDADDVQILYPGECIVTGDLAPHAPLRVKIRRRYTVHGGAGFNVLEHAGEGEPLRKAELVEKLRAQITAEQLAAAQAGAGFAPSAAGREEEASALDALRKENEELKQRVRDLEVELERARQGLVPEALSSPPGPDLAEMEALRGENERLRAAVRDLESKLAQAMVDVEREKKRTLRAIKLADEAVQEAKKAREGL